MLTRKFGLNAYKILVVKRNSFQDTPVVCRWLGHSRFRCSLCKLGYFDVHSESRYDNECPECKAIVIIRLVDEG